jgi:hypothetical protein
MAYELREGQGTLFRNDKREKDSQPNARGEAMIGGVVYEISAWTKEGKKGKFQSLSIKPKEERREKPAPKRERDDPRTMGHDDRDYQGEMYGHGEDDGEVPF